VEKFDWFVVVAFALVGAALLKIIRQQGASAMREEEMITDVKALTAEFNTATNAVATRLEAAIAKADEVEGGEEVVSLLRAEVQRLQVLGADPTNPVPPEEEEPPVE
jgi:hypothetical protein